MTGDRRAMRHKTYSLTALLLIVVVAIVALSSGLQIAQKKLDEGLYAFPHETLKALGGVQSRFKRKDLDEDGVEDYATSLGELEQAEVITKKLASGAVQGYRYEIVEAVSGERYAMTATPAEVTTASLFYFMDQSHIIRARAGAPADAQSEIYWHPLRGIQWKGSAGR